MRPQNIFRKKPCKWSEICQRHLGNRGLKPKRLQPRTSVTHIITYHRHPFDLGRLLKSNVVLVGGRSPDDPLSRISLKSRSTRTYFWNGCKPPSSLDPATSRLGEYPRCLYRTVSKNPEKGQNHTSGTMRGWGPVGINVHLVWQQVKVLCDVGMTVVTRWLS